MLESNESRFQVPPDDRIATLGALHRSFPGNGVANDSQRVGRAAGSGSVGLRGQIVEHSIFTLNSVSLSHHRFGGFPADVRLRG